MPVSVSPQYVQHGHTSGEHAVYVALWNLGGSPDRKDAYRDVTIGYDKLAANSGDRSGTFSV